MITKDSYSITLKSLHQGKGLRDHDGTAEALFALNHEISRLHTLPAGAPAKPGTKRQSQKARQAADPDVRVVTGDLRSGVRRLLLGVVLAAAQPADLGVDEV